ncbi:MAG: ABC transporter permease [Saprospiraceae bacterium]|nr:ABC transporter permease [Saprospiraceae bacterium]
MPVQPPKWAMKFLEWTCSSTFLDELEGDLLELFDRDLERNGPKKARRRFARKALLSPRWHRFPKLTNYHPVIMYKSHFKVAIRHAMRHRSATFIQALGLTLGLTAVFFIALYVKYEASYDHMHEKRDSLYRVLRYNPVDGSRGHATSSLHGTTLKEEFPFINVSRYGSDPVKIGEVKPLLVEEFYWADSSFFELFTFDFIAGDPTSCLDEVNSLVITASLSRQLFGTTNSLGKTIPVKVYDGNQEFLMEVKAVVKDLPDQSHIQFAALGPMENAEMLYKQLLNQWGFSWLRTYIEVPQDRLAEVKDGIPRMLERVMGDNRPSSFGIDLQAFNDVYLKSQDIAASTFRGNIRNLKIFAAIGLLVLLISLLNYVNLATARAVTRIKEVGVRKTLGALPAGIMGQFIVESVLFTLLGGAAAVCLVIGSLPYINNLLSLDLSIKVLGLWDGLVLLASLIALGIITGILPALAMSKLPSLGDTQAALTFKPGQGSWTRKAFIGIQYFVSIGLLVGAFAVYKQYQYLKNFDLGFDSSQLVHIPVDDRDMQKKLGLIKEQINGLPGVQGVTTTGEDLPSELNNTWDLNWNGSGRENPLPIDIVGVDQDYFDLIGIDFKDGHNFRAGYATDSARTVVFNEEARKYLGDQYQPGQEVFINGQNRKLIGVVENHHNITLHSKVLPIAYMIFPAGFRVSADNLLVKISTDQLSSQLEQLEDVWKEFSGDPFSYNFVDEAFAKAYQAEQRFSTLVGFFTLIAIAISIVGLFGLVSFTVQRKLKEISIRRILGATELQLTQLLGKDFLMVFIIALIFALPMAWYLIGKWLNNFAYKIELNPLILVAAVLICLILSAIVIVYHLQRTTKINPSTILSSE